MDKVLIAVDPGANGGIAWFQIGKGVQAVKMPDDEDGFRALALAIKGASDGLPVKLYVEKVGGFIKPQDEADEDRENRQPGHTMFVFGRNVGAIIMAFRMIGAEVQEVAPVTWQKPFFLKRHGASKAAWKNMLKNAAQRRFPGIKVTLSKADALLILAFASLRESAPGILDAGQTWQGEAPARGNRQISGSRPESSGKTKMPARGERPRNIDGNDAGLSRDSAESGRAGLYVVNWNGAFWVLNKATNSLLRRATQCDVASLPRR